MTNPPPPGNWGPPQPGPQQPYGQGQPPYGPPGQWPQQPDWGPPPPPPKNNSLKWLLIGVAVLLVIAITVGATLLFTRDGGGDPPTATENAPVAGDIASANDTGPVTVITEDPTCAAWRPIATTLSKQESQGWQNRDFTTPGTAWTSEERAMHESVADAMRSAANETVALSKRTPHRVMRHLYEQSIAYWRKYADSVAKYTENDNSYAVAASNASSAIVSICGAIEHGAAAARAQLVETGDPPNSVSSVEDSDDPQVFLPRPNNVCTEWNSASDSFDQSISDWQEFDANKPAGEWTPAEREIMLRAASKMEDYSALLRNIGERSDDPVFRDFSELAATYWLSYSKSLPTHIPSDNYLSATAAYVVYMLYHACEAAD